MRREIQKFSSVGLKFRISEELRDFPVLVFYLIFLLFMLGFEDRSEFLRKASRIRWHMPCKARWQLCYDLKDWALFDFEVSMSVQRHAPSQSSCWWCGTKVWAWQVDLHTKAPIAAGRNPWDAYETSRTAQYLTWSHACGETCHRSPLTLF